MTYNFCVLKVRPGQVAPLLKGLEGWLGEAGLAGRLVGCWFSEIGQLNRVALLHAYPDRAAAGRDLSILSESGTTFGMPDAVEEFTADSFESFPGAEAELTGEIGPIYEIRTYRLKSASVPATMEAWAKVLPQRREISPLLTVMHAASGSMQRFVHIWPYRTIEDRMRLRAESVEKGVWPPPGGLPHIVEMQSDIYLPAAFSPAR